MKIVTCTLKRRKLQAGNIFELFVTLVWPHSECAVQFFVQLLQDRLRNIPFRERGEMFNLYSLRGRKLLLENTLNFLPSCLAWVRPHLEYAVQCLVPVLQ